MSCHLLQCRFGTHIIYQKYIVSVMCSLALLIVHGSRYTLTSTINAMTAHEKDHDDGEDECNRAGPLQTSSEVHLEWPYGKSAYVLSAFYLGYVFQVPFGVLPDLYGAKHIMSMGVTGSMVITLSLPFILTQVPWYVMAAVQMILGLIQALCQVSVLSLMSQYIPRRQVSFLLAFVYIGPNLGGTIANYFISILRNWAMPFFIWTTVSVVWLVWFVILIHSTPSNHPFICDSEKASLQADFGVHLPSTIPIREILVDPGIWALVAVQIGNNVLIFITETFLPKMIKRMLHLNDNFELYIIAIPSVFGYASAIGSGYLSDYLIMNRYLPVSYTRTLYVTCGILAQNIFIILATYTNCIPVLFLACITMAMTAKGVAFPGIKSNIFDLTRHYVGTVQGLQNGLASSIGLIIPPLIEYVGEWRKIFWLTLVVCLFTTTLYFVWSESEPAKWDKVKPRKEKIVLG